MLAIGEEAREMIGRTPGNIVAIRPMRDGVIADYDMTESMIRYFLDKVVGRTLLFRPRLMICVPSGISGVERRAVQEAAEQAGAKRAELIEEPIAAALGAGVDIAEPVGTMIVDIGGGTCDVAVISLGGIVNGESLLIGERTSENIKTTIGAAYKGARNLDMEVRGRDIVTGMPKNITVATDEVAEALRESVESIVNCVRRVLDVTPPELSADIFDRGIIMTGGGALLYGLDEIIRRETQIPTVIADDPMSCVAIGTGKALEYNRDF